MNRDFLEALPSRLHGLRRDRENGLFYGVCAGIADRFGWPVTTVRLFTILSLIVFFLPTAIIYVAAGLLLPAKPLTFYGAREDRFWKTQGRRNSRRWCA
jgi:phage shock protein C